MGDEVKCAAVLFQLIEKQQGSALTRNAEDRLGAEPNQLSRQKRNVTHLQIS
jgi:hypothetical protein